MADEQLSKFNDAGILVVVYRAEDSALENGFRRALQRIREQVVFDFAIICALDVERDAYGRTRATVSGYRNIRGLDCAVMELGTFRGVCVKLPRMGLVEAAVTTARAIERFSPQIVAMSGICAGVKDKADVGTLIVADPCWEYQAGKWAEDDFKIEHYDVSIPTAMRVDISQFIAADRKGDKYKRDLEHEEIHQRDIIIAPMATGSAVIANNDRMKEIGDQHRKMAGVEMEMYGVYKAAEMSASNPAVFGAKTVVDAGDKNKGDLYHEYGSVLSARFVVDVISMLMERPRFA